MAVKGSSSTNNKSGRNEQGIGSQQNNTVLQSMCALFGEGARTECKVVQAGMFSGFVIVMRPPEVVGMGATA